MPRSLSILVPALNEAAHIEATVRGVLQAVDALGLDAEVLVLSCLDENGFSDGTVDIVRGLAATDSRIQSVHTSGYQRLADKFRAGALLASKTHLAMVPGDNQTGAHSLERVFARIGVADMVLSYPANTGVRPWHRRLLSAAYTLGVNTLFGHQVAYYHGINVYRTADVRAHLPETDSLALFAELVLRLLQAGRTYIEVPGLLEVRPERTRLLKWKNARRLVVDLLRLRWRLRCAGPSKFLDSP